MPAATRIALRRQRMPCSWWDGRLRLPSDTARQVTAASSGFAVGGLKPRELGRRCRLARTATTIRRGLLPGSAPRRFSMTTSDPSGESMGNARFFTMQPSDSFADYPERRVGYRAVRGETLALIWARLWDDVGNESTSFNLLELASDGLVGYHARFDGTTSRARTGNSKRYYAGEGAPFAHNGHTAYAWQIAHRDQGGCAPVIARLRRLVTPRPKPEVRFGRSVLRLAGLTRHGSCRGCGLGRLR